MVLPNNRLENIHHSAAIWADYASLGIENLPHPFPHLENPTHSSPTPIVHDDAIYVHFGAMGLAAPVWVTGAR